MKKLLILGATGGTGRHLIAQALEAGHEVTAFVRDPAKLVSRHQRLRLVVGAIPDDVGPLQDPMKGQHAVISALGRGQLLQSEHVIERSVPPLLAAMQAASVRRLVFTSAIGVGGAYSEAPLSAKLTIRVLLKDIYADKLIGENLIRKSDVDWTIVQPARLTDGPLTRKYRAAEHLVHRTFASVSRADVAHFLLSQLDDRTYLRKVVHLAY